MATTWRVARSLLTLRDQLNTAHPLRSKAADGTIGDAAHAASVSDHNPDSAGVVRALDLTHDPANGVDAGALAEHLRASRDPRIKYLISNARICSSYPAHGYDAWAWRPYSGLNAHRSHVHVSVVADTRADSIGAWQLTTTQEEDMQLTDDNLRAIAKAVWDRPVLTGGPKNEARPAHQLLSQTPKRTWNLPLANQGDPRPAHQVLAIAAHPEQVARLVVDELTPLIEASGGTPLTAEQLDASLRRVIGSVDEVTS